MDVFEKIDTWLSENHMSRRQLAIKAGIPATTFQSLMQRRKDISSANLAKIAEVMGVSVDALITEEVYTLPSGGSVSFLNDPSSDFLRIDIKEVSSSELLGILKASNLSVDELVEMYKGFKTEGAPAQHIMLLLDLIMERATEYLSYAVSEKATYQK